MRAIGLATLSRPRRSCSGIARAGAQTTRPLALEPGSIPTTGSGVQPPVAARRRPGGRAGWRVVRPYVPAAVVVIGARLRFAFTPITSDEGGYLAIARAWGRGAVLYEDVWVDRPQGLLVVYRVLAWVGLGTPAGVRVLAIAACLLGSVACGSIAATLFGDPARPLAALSVGTLTSVPQYEGFIANAELLSGAAGAVSLAVILRAVWRRDRPDLVLLCLGGVAGGCAMTIRQSGFDAFAAGGVAVMLASASWTARTRVRAAAIVLLGLLAPIGLAAAHGALTGWDRWWDAVVGYRLGHRSAIADANWDRLGRSFSIAAPALLPALALVAVALIVQVVRRRVGIAATVVLVAWCAFAVPAFLLGGQFHRHYWVIVMFPLGTVAGAVSATVERRSLRTALVVLVLARPVTMTVEAATLPRHEVPAATSGDPRLLKDERVAAWFDVHRSLGDDLYVMCWSAGAYGNVDVDPPFPYLWADHMRQVPDAVPALAALLSGRDPPSFVAAYQHPGSCDRSGRVGALIASRYDRVASVDGIGIHRWTGR